MYSTRCTSCKQIITLKGDEIKAALDEAEAAKRNIYEMRCPKCRRPVRIQVKMLKLRLPRAIPESLDGKAAGQETEGEDTDKA
jgi:hypothetical protein